MELNVSKIQYISRDYGIIVPKEYTYLHCLSKSSKYPGADWKYIANNEPFDENTTCENILNEWITYVNNEVNVSKKCKLLTFTKNWQQQFTSFDGLELSPEYKVESVLISNNLDYLPDLGVVWEINRIAPRMCGMLFENIIAHCLHTPEKPFDISNEISDFSSIISNKTIIGILERNFIDKSLLRKGNMIEISKNRKLTIGGEKLSEEHFIDKWRYMLWMSLRHFMKRDLVGSDLEDCLNILDYIKINIDDMESYYDQMESSTLINQMKKEYFTHGNTYRNENLHGEVDFISSESIVDCKCYKSEEGVLDDWFAQLWLYEKLAGTRRKKWIVNVYSNKVYKFEAI